MFNLLTPILIPKKQPYNADADIDIIGWPMFEPNSEHERYSSVVRFYCACDEQMRDWVNRYGLLAYVVIARSDSGPMWLVCHDP